MEGDRQTITSAMPQAPSINNHPSFLDASQSYEEVNRLLKYKNDAYAEAKQFVESID